MPSIAAADSASIRDLQDRITAGIRPDASLEEASQHCVDVLYGAFAESVPLLRIFVSVPFGALPPPERRAAQHAAGSEELDDAMSVLALMGTRGSGSSWNARVDSVGHRAIPILAGSFVANAPMILRLFRDLGAGHAGEEDIGVVRRVLGGGLAGVFHVPDARAATDAGGRLVIPSRDFVLANRVQTVFGVGGSYTAGCMVVAVFFTNERVEREVADLFTRAISSFKRATMRAALEKRFFRHAPSRAVGG